MRHLFSPQVPRPMSMKKDGIQTRKRKPKGMGKSKAKKGLKTETSSAEEDHQPGIKTRVEAALEIYITIPFLAII